MYNKNIIKDDIIIFGLGNIGLTCLFYLLDKKYKKITVFVKPNKDLKNLKKIINKEYNVDIKIIYTLKHYNYNTYIETTGDSYLLKSIFDNINYNKKLIILSTPREETFLLSPLSINRKNISVIGAHEINGIDNEYRNRVFNKLLRKNSKKKYLHNFVSIYDYSDKKLKEIKEQKGNFIEMFKY